MGVARDLTKGFISSAKRRGRLRHIDFVLLVKPLGCLARRSARKCEVGAMNKKYKSYVLNMAAVLLGLRRFSARFLRAINKYYAGILVIDRHPTSS